jgi:hypothetical protein
MHCAVLIATAMISCPSVSVQEILDRAVETAARVVVLPEGRVEVTGKLRVRRAENLVIEELWFSPIVRVLPGPSTPAATSRFAGSRSTMIHCHTYKDASQADQKMGSGTISR